MYRVIDQDLNLKIATGNFKQMVQMVRNIFPEVKLSVNETECQMDFYFDRKLAPELEVQIGFSEVNEGYEIDDEGILAYCFLGSDSSDEEYDFLVVPEEFESKIDKSIYFSILDRSGFKDLKYFLLSLNEQIEKNYK